MKKLNNDDFIKKSKNLYGDTYDYSLVDYKNSSTKVKIICDKHGIFEQTPNGHLSGRGCDLCGKNNKKLNIEKFVEKSTKRHGNKYDYSNVDIVDSKNKVSIICKKHGEFFQRPTDHYILGCPKCGKYSDTENFIKKSIDIHGNKYDYSKVDYVDNTTPVKIICKKHGEFLQKPSHHLLKSGCPICSIEKSKLKIEDFIENSIKVHGNKYDYSKVVMNRGDKIKIICKKHGIFLQTPSNHQRGKGCPICNESKGERKICDFLEKNNIKYVRQKKFDDCFYIKKLIFDFYLDDYNICIEFDGQQHFEILDYFGGEKLLKENKIRDNIKNLYCLENNILLIRIRYNENIEEKLNSVFNKL